MRCVVTGAAGFIGHRLCARLLDDGYHVTAVDFTIPSMPDRRAVWQRCSGQIVADLRNSHEAVEAMYGADWVFHLAANCGGVGFQTFNHWQPYLDNTRMSLNVLEACERIDTIDRLFYASSSCAFPIDRQAWGNVAELTEDGDLETGPPDTMYGREKLATLRLCEEAPFDARVGMFNSAYGPGLAVEGDRMKFPAAIARRALHSRKTGQPLTVWGDGSQVRAYIYVDDLVDKIMTMMLEPYDGPVTLGSWERITCTEGAETTLNLLGVDVPIVYDLDGPRGVDSRNCSNEKWERVYGPDKSRSFREGQTELLAWMERFVG